MVQVEDTASHSKRGEEAAAAECESAMQRDINRSMKILNCLTSARLLTQLQACCCYYHYYLHHTGSDTAIKKC
jgi:hypothetical protein